VQCVQHADEVHVDGVQHRAQRLGGAHRRDAGLRDHHVQPAELAQPLVHRGAHGRRVPHVGAHRDDPPVQLLHQAAGLGQVRRGGQRIGHRVDVRAQVDGHDVGALGGEPYRVRAALAAARAGDQGDLAGDPAARLARVLAMLPLPVQSNNAI